jgi:hypothetical protein
MGRQAKETKPLGLLEATLLIPEKCSSLGRLQAQLANREEKESGKARKEKERDASKCNG